MGQAQMLHLPVDVDGGVLLLVIRLTTVVSSANLMIKLET
jgi:hypothetical protein